MGAVVFSMERVLVVSIRQDAALPGKLAAAAWRSLIATLAAALVTMPFALALFNNGILARLDDEKLALMAEKRRAIDAVFDLKTRAADITAVERELAANRAQQDQLPAPVQALLAARDECERDRVPLQHSLLPKIAAANTRYAAILHEINDAPEASAGLRRRLAAVGAQIGEWRAALAAKERACADLGRQFEDGRQKYLLQLDSERQRQLARREEAQKRFDQTQQNADVTLVRSDAVVARVTAPDLSARIRALGQMAYRDPLVAIVLGIAYSFFFLVDILPVLAKLVMRTTYDPRISADHRRAAARIQTDTAIAEADAAMRAEIVEAERRGLEMLLRQPDGEFVLELARVRARSEIEKAEIAAQFAQVNALIDAFLAARARLDEIADPYGDRPELAAHIEAVREALSKAMASASASVRPQPAAASSA